MFSGTTNFHLGDKNESWRLNDKFIILNVKDD